MITPFLAVLTISSVSVPLWLIVIVIGIIGWLAISWAYEHDSKYDDNMTPLGRMFIAMVFIIIVLFLELIVSYFSK